MTTPCSGTISAQDIEDEFTGSHEIRISEYFGADKNQLVPTIPVATNTIRWSDFYCKNKDAPGVLSVAGGNFIPSSGYEDSNYYRTKVYTLSNTGDTPINWSYSDNASWVSATSTSGTLSGHSSVNVTVVINNTFYTPGTYNSTITFTNTTNGVGNTSLTARATILENIWTVSSVTQDPFVTDTLTPCSGINTGTYIEEHTSQRAYGRLTVTNVSSSTTFSYSEVGGVTCYSNCNNTLTPGQSATVLAYMNTSGSDAPSGTPIGYGRDFEVQNSVTGEIRGGNLSYAPQHPPVLTASNGTMDVSAGSSFGPSEGEIISQSYNVAERITWQISNTGGGTVFGQAYRLGFRITLPSWLSASTSSGSRVGYVCGSVSSGNTVTASAYLYRPVSENAAVGSLFGDVIFTNLSGEDSLGTVTHGVRLDVFKKPNILGPFVTSAGGNLPQPFAIPKGYSTSYTGKMIAEFDTGNTASTPWTYSISDNVNWLTVGGVTTGLSMTSKGQTRTHNITINSNMSSLAGSANGTTHTGWVTLNPNIYSINNTQSIRLAVYTTPMSVSLLKVTTGGTYYYTVYNNGTQYNLRITASYSMSGITGTWSPTTFTLAPGASTNIYFTLGTVTATWSVSSTYYGVVVDGAGTSLGVNASSGNGTTRYTSYTGTNQ